MSTSRRGGRFPSLGLVAVMGLAACQTSAPPGPPQAPVARPSPLVVPADARTYAVVGRESVLQILVYRGGPMARMGHNHVIASRHLEGVVHLGADPAQARFDVRIPVNELTVDEPLLREAAGPDFPKDIPLSARDGTRRNLLSAALLDGANHPQILLRATDVKPRSGEWDVGIDITFKERVYPVRVPVTMELREGALIARGEFTLHQSELGLEPFSVAMGSLVVLDEMRVRFEFVARE